MNRRFILAPGAVRDLTQIWRYIKKKSSRETADRVEAVIRGKFVYLADFPHAGHWRRDLTDASVRFFSVYSYLIVYRPGNCAVTDCRRIARQPERRSGSFKATGTLKIAPRRTG